MKLSNQSRLAALEQITADAAVPSGLAAFYPDTDASPTELEQAERLREQAAKILYPDFDPISGEPLNDRGRALMQPPGLV